jgi:hypothetical protein
MVLLFADIGLILYIQQHLGGRIEIHSQNGFAVKTTIPIMQEQVVSVYAD